VSPTNNTRCRSARPEIATIGQLPADRIAPINASRARSETKQTSRGREVRELPPRGTRSKAEAGRVKFMELPAARRTFGMHVLHHTQNLGAAKNLGTAWM
jgi:hypothetical protein